MVELSAAALSDSKRVSKYPHAFQIATIRDAPA